MNYYKECSQSVRKTIKKTYKLCGNLMVRKVIKNQGAKVWKINKGILNH